MKVDYFKHKMIRAKERDTDNFKLVFDIHTNKIIRFTRTPNKHLPKKHRNYAVIFKVQGIVYISLASLIDRFNLPALEIFHRLTSKKYRDWKILEPE